MTEFIGLKVTPTERKQLEKLAKGKRGISTVVREAVKLYVDQQPKKT